MKLRTDGVTWQEIDGELVVLDLRSQKYLTTNATGAFLMKRLTEHRETGELVDALVAEFGIDESQAAQDVSGFLDSLDRSGLLERGAGD
ncbi:MAG: PqqD family protein [Propionicimonas sp.]|nr:PqqD family protein [Propionicimonas sp.]